MKSNLIARREFLRGTGLILGSALVSPTAFAKAFTTPSGALTVYFRANEGWVLADRVTSSDGLQQVRLTVSGGSRAGDLRLLEALYVVPTAAGMKEYPFRAWMPGSETARFTAPVRADGTIRFRMTRGSNASDLVFGSSGYPLREGTYLIAGPGAKVQSIDPDQLGSADIDYCLLRIEAV